MINIYDHIFLSFYFFKEFYAFSSCICVFDLFCVDFASGVAGPSCLLWHVDVHLSTW